MQVFDYFNHLINAICCWDFKLNDHEKLAKLNIPQLLSKPGGDSAHLLALCWGKEAKYEVLNLSKVSEFDIGARLNQAFTFFCKNIIASVTVEKDAKGKI